MIVSVTLPSSPVTYSKSLYETYWSNLSLPVRIFHLDTLSPRLSGPRLLASFLELEGAVGMYPRYVVPLAKLGKICIHHLSAAIILDNSAHSTNRTQSPLHQYVFIYEALVAIAVPENHSAVPSACLLTDWFSYSSQVVCI
jgi:hypothetical protein